MFLLLGMGWAQEVKVELGPDEIGINETFTIKVTLSNEKIKSYDQFPEIQGFQKQGISQSSSMNIINGQMSSSNSVIQYYKPSRKGQFTLGRFSVLINGKSYASAGKRITVKDAVTNQGATGNAYDPFAEKTKAQQAMPMTPLPIFLEGVLKLLNLSKSLTMPFLPLQ